MSQIIYPAIFNGTDLTIVNGLTVIETNPYVPAKRSLTINDIARTNKSKVSSDFYTQRMLSVKVAISRSSRPLLEQSLDNLWSLIQGVEGTLVLNQSGGNRGYICTYQDSLLTDDGGSSIKIELIFVCSDRFGYDVIQTQALQINSISDPSRADAVTFIGSAAWQVPVATFTFTSVVGGTTKIVTFGNPATGQVISITRTWATGDVLVVDSYNKTVTANGTAVAFTGSFPEWASTSSGVAGGISYSDTFTGRQFGLQILYYKRYI